MANITFETAFKRLSLRSSTVCRQCRRAFASTASRQENMSATRAFADQLQSSRTQSSASRAPRSPSSPVQVPSSQPDSWATAVGFLTKSQQKRKELEEAEKLADIERQFGRADLERQTHRRFKVGDVYAPHDLTGVEMAKWKKLRRKGRQRWDVVDQLGMDPREHYKNFAIMSEYMTEMGRIKHSRETGLRPRNQRRMAKAIRRAIGIGLMPGVHRHPELLRHELDKRSM